MERILRLCTYIDGINDVAFPTVDSQIEIGTFKYNAKRMGGAPTITATVMYPTCLDNVWTQKVYALFNGERYYLKQTPTSSFSNEDARYKHELELISERVALDDVYFFDVVVANPEEEDKPISNSTTVNFFGNIEEFVRRLNSSLEFSGLEYRAYVNEEILNGELEEKMMNFEKQFISNVLQEIYNTYQLPYYFKNKEIRIGFSDENSVPLEIFEYGVDNALLAITKTNANYKVVNRATGVGSSENIPYYYPNNTPKGDISLEVNGADPNLDIAIVDYELFARSINFDKPLTYTADNKKLYASYNSTFYTDAYDNTRLGVSYQTNVRFYQTTKCTLLCQTNVKSESKIWEAHTRPSYKVQFLLGDKVIFSANVVENTPAAIYISGGEYTVRTTLQMTFTHDSDTTLNITSNTAISTDTINTYWDYDGTKIADISTIGLKHKGGTLNFGDTVEQKFIRKINSATTLLPSIYRATDGKNRFYNAVNEQPFESDAVDSDGNPMYTLDYNTIDGFDNFEFPNPFVVGKPKEHIVEVSDIKPSIKGMTYTDSQGDEYAIDKFLEVAFDENDNNDTYVDEDDNETTYLQHPYFFVKLPPLGFNLFDHAIEGQPMTIEMTSGDCGACKFTIAVDDESQKNLVQVKVDGSLLYDSDGYVVCGSKSANQNKVEPQRVQQDTTNHSVWIALTKEEDTYGILMPYAPDDKTIVGHRPKGVKDETEDATGKTKADTYIITGINLPQPYILSAEKKLEAEIIKYLKDNNNEKFNFSISFSRIYFAENPDVLALLNENSRLTIRYNSKEYTLYVSSFSYDMNGDAALPQISVELDDKLTISQNALQNSINEVKSEAFDFINSIDVVAAATPNFIKKRENDDVTGVINFKKGLKFGEGGIVHILNNNSAKLTIDYLEVTKKATFTSLEIQEKTHVGGQILVTPAAINCGEVEEFEEFYRCYFQTMGEDGDEIFNPFAIGDQAIHQTYNAMGSRYYWRLVVNIGEDYIDLSKRDGEYDEESSDEPMVGDKIIQLGSQTNESRQNAIVLAAYGEGSPYFVQYKGINSFSISDGNIVTKFSPDGNLITGVLRIENGSTGLENVEGWAEMQESISNVYTKFEVLEGEIRSEITSIRQDLGADGYLSNYTFDEGFKNWSTANNNASIKPYKIGNKLVWINDTLLADNGNGVRVIEDDGRNVVNIKAATLIQKNANMQKYADSDVVVNVSFLYKLISQGGLMMVSIGDKTYTQSCYPSTEYQLFTRTFNWDGTGDFKIRMVYGEINIYKILVVPDNLATTYQTLFEQSDKLAKLSANNLDADGNVTAESAIMVKAEGAGIYTQDEEGNLATVGTYEDGVVKLTGNHIKLEGLVTANENFKVLEDGSIETTNGKFTGIISAEEGNIGALRIIDNELVGEDENGVQSVRIGVGAIPSISGTNIVSDIPFTFTTIATKDTSPMIEHVSGTSYGKTANQLDCYIEVSQSGVIESHVGFTLAITFTIPYMPIASGVVLKDIGIGVENTQSGTAPTSLVSVMRLYKLNTSGGYTQLGSLFPVTSSPQGNDVTLSNIQLSGTYKLEADVFVQYPTQAWQGDIFFQLAKIESTSLNTNVGFCTHIAKDGIICIQGADKYFRFSESTGGEIRFGNFGIKVDSTGAWTLTDGTWKRIATN